MKLTLHKQDIPDDLDFGSSVAVDTETMGLNQNRDRLCVVQLSSGDGQAHLVQCDRDSYDAPNLKKLLADQNVVKIFHFARFDLAVIKKYLGVECRPVFCTKIASRLARTYTDKHSLKNVCKELLDIDISKQQQSSDWGAENLSKDQMKYAAGDVLYLHEIKDKLEYMLEREGRTAMAQACFDFLPHRAELDLRGWPNVDIFSHDTKIAS